MNAVIKKAVKGKWLRQEEKWGEFVIKTATKKYDFKEKAVIDTDDVFKLSVGGRAYDDAKNWEHGTTRDIEVEVHGDAFQYQNEWKYGVKLSFERFVETKSNPFKGKEESNEEPSDDLPF